MLVIGDLSKQYGRELEISSLLRTYCVCIREVPTSHSFVILQCQAANSTIYPKLLDLETTIFPSWNYLGASLFHSGFRNKVQ
jgi:hypothetical protein